MFQYISDAANKTLTYYSSNPEIAQVTNEGRLLPIKTGQLLLP